MSHFRVIIARIVVVKIGSPVSIDAFMLRLNFLAGILIELRNISQKIKN